MAEIIFISDILLISLAFLWIFAASFTDLKKREVPNWLSFSLIFIALAIRGLAALIEKQPLYFLYGLTALAIFFLLANLFYYTRIFGGGDTKLLMALSVVFATKPSFIMELQEYTLLGFNEPFLMIFLINSFVLGSIYGLVFSVVAALKNKKFHKEYNKISKKMRFIRTLFWLVAFVCLVFAFFSSKWFFAIFAVLFVTPPLYSFIKAAENSAMIKELSAREIREGDWITKPIRVKNRIIKPSIHGLTKKDISLIKKSRKKITVKYGLPFVPVFLLALIVSLFVGDLLFIVVNFLFGI